MSESTLVKDAKGRSRGFAFVQLDSKEAANHAMQKLNGTAMGGRNIAVDWALAKAKFLEHAQAKPATVAEDDEKKGDEEVVDKDKGKQKRKKKENEEANEGKEEPEPEEGGDEGNEDVEGSDDNDEENDEEDSEKKSKSKTKEPRPSDVKEGRTVFVRNLLFSATTEEVQERFAKFGEINYCVLVTDPSTGISRGSAFVQFKNKEAVDAVMREAYPYGRKQQPAKHQKRQASKSMLEGMSELLVHGRPVVVDVAVERGTAAQLKEQHVRQKDKRNLYLLNEGGTLLCLRMWSQLAYAASDR